MALWAGVSVYLAGVKHQKAPPAASCHPPLALRSLTDLRCAGGLITCTEKAGCFLEPSPEVSAE